MTILELAELYVSSRILSEGHKQQILRVARRFLVATGTREIRDIGPQELVSFLSYLNTITGNVNTKASYLAHIAILLRYAQRCGLIQTVPVLPEIKRARRVPRAWGFDEFRRLYAVANCLPGRVGVHLARIWWPSLIATAYHTASRIGALLQVKWQDLDLERGFLLLRAESTKTRTEQVFYLPEYVRTKVGELRWPERELVWEWPHCRRYFFTYFRKHIARPAQLEPLAGERFGLFHKVRRTAASLAAAQAGIAAAQTLLGHTSARTTIEHYLDPRIVGGSSANLPSLE